MIFCDWIAIDFTEIILVFLALSLIYVGLWIVILRKLGSKGWLLLASWVMMHILVIRFVYAWNRNDFDMALVAGYISLVISFFILFVKSEWLVSRVLVTSFVSFLCLFLVFVFFIEKNETAFLSYKMAVKGKFEYPPYSTFKKEVDWSSFFQKHSDRKWIREALVVFFENNIVY